MSARQDAERGTPLHSQSTSIAYRDISLSARVDRTSNVQAQPELSTTRRGASVNDTRRLSQLLPARDVLRH